MTSESINGVTLDVAYDSFGNPVTRTYASGRTLTISYDELERPAAITDGATGLIAEYDYVGQRVRFEREEDLAACVHPFGATRSGVELQVMTIFAQTAAVSLR